MTNEEIKENNTALKNFKITLEEKIKESDQVFITGHIRPDFDAISSAIGLSLIAKKFKKESYILIDESAYANAAVKGIIDKVSSMVNIIPINTFKTIKGTNDLLITTDTNKTNLVCCENCLSAFKNIIIIDHHFEDEKTIKTESKFIRPNMSSACEIVTALLHQFGVKYSEEIANYLLAGIALDTNRLTKNASQNTFEIVTKLHGKGASMDVVNELFTENFESDRRVQSLINVTDFYNYNFAICCGSNEQVFTKEEIAKAADGLLKYQTDASFAIGKTDEETTVISARSKGKINVGKIMGELNGGGSIYAAATSIKHENPKETEKKLVKLLKPNFYIEEQ